MNFFDAIVSSIFPVRCPFCGKPLPQGGDFCKDCESALSRISDPVCPKCGRNYTYCKCGGKIYAFERCVQPFYYEGAVKKALLNFKFFGHEGGARVFASYAAETVKNAYSGISFDFVTSVPLSKAEIKKRGFNQSELFGHALAKKLRLPYRETLLKPLNLPPQHTLSSPARWKNIDGAFSPVKKICGARILLADDIITTGATLNECSKVLKNAGAEYVFCAAIASTKHDFRSI